MSDAKSVLVVEDEAVIAMMNKAWLTRMGFRVRVESSLDTALGCLDGAVFQLALVDMNLGGKSSDPLIAELRALGVPTLLATGYSPHELGEFAQTFPCLQKPLNFGALRSAIHGLLA